jgi:hypothetical protein
MFNRVIHQQTLPSYLSSDNDPLYRFQRWQGNLRVLEIQEIKTVPYVPLSHPFVERLIGTIRREYLDQTPIVRSQSGRGGVPHCKIERLAADYADAAKTSAVFLIVLTSPEEARFRGLEED